MTERKRHILISGMDLGPEDIACPDRDGGGNHCPHEDSMYVTEPNIVIVRCCWCADEWETQAVQGVPHGPYQFAPKPSVE